MKNSYDTIGNRTRDLPDCRAVPQPTASPVACPLESILDGSKHQGTTSHFLSHIMMCTYSTVILRMALHLTFCLKEFVGSVENERRLVGRTSNITDVIL